MNKKTLNTPMDYQLQLDCFSGNRNGCEYWKDENGNNLNENKELKKKLNKKIVYINLSCLLNIG